MTVSIDNVEGDRALKAKHRAIWALGDYPSVAAELIPDLGAVLVEACGVIRAATECWTWRPARAMPPSPRPWPE